MDRIELRKFLDEERAHALKWYSEAEQAKAAAEVVLEEIRDSLRVKKKKGGVTAEELEELRDALEEAKDVWREARKQLIFFDGVKQGIDAVARQLGERLAREELANAGRWIPKIHKPRMR